MRKGYLMALAAVALAGLIGLTVGATPAPSGNYPLDTCVVSGQKLGAMGPAVIYNYKGREVRFCCPGCIPEFEKNPAKYLAVLDKAGQVSPPASQPEQPGRHVHSEQATSQPAQPMLHEHGTTQPAGEHAQTPVPQGHHGEMH